ncbi:MAG: hypothetical protein KJ566_00825 [Nanoarchaeota archaeon]|nr:hypothetical protein [Nanoarchaeota archaeon]
MKKQLIFLVLLVMVLPGIFAINIDVKRASTGQVMIAELNNPLSFNLEITNSGDTNDFEFYNLASFDMQPIGFTRIEKDQTRNIELILTSLKDFTYRGFYTFSYFIRDSNDDEVQEQVIFKITDLKSSFLIGSGEIDPNSNTIEVFIQNKENFNFSKMSAKFSSVFFDIEKEFELSPKEKKTFEVQLNKEDFNKILAGFYTMKAEIEVQEKKATIEGIIKFNEEELIETTKENSGFFINTKTITKKNNGNVAVQPEIVFKKNIISRLFTTFSPEPELVERDGAKVYYTWNLNLLPGETLEIKIKTNWFFPFLGIILIIAIVVLVKKYSASDLVLRKKVSFVKAKGGEFALKVSLFVKARKYVERVNIIDRLPPLVKIYEKFGGEQPTRISKENKRIEWNFEKLESGEIRMISYIIYSKIGVLGKFALPSALSIYEREGKIKETRSNQAFFVAEQRKGQVEEGD